MEPARARELNASIRTARLDLEPLVVAHAVEMVLPLQDPRIYTWISTPVPASARALGDVWQRITETRLSPDGTRAWLNWAVRRINDGVVVGKLDAEVTEDGVATNVGYLFFPFAWGAGIATEAVRALSDAFVDAGVHEQHATVTVGNVASCRVLVKAGFEDEGLLLANDTIRGTVHDDHHFVRRTRGLSADEA